jgi:rare lipoprotein A
MLVCLLAAPAALAAPSQHDKHVAVRTHHVQYRHHVQHGRISYYHPKLAGRKMADGNRFRPQSNAAASKVLPLGSKAKVTNLKNGKSTVVHVEDRGPYVGKRIMDVSPATAQVLGMRKDGVVEAEVTPLGTSQD